MTDTTIRTKNRRTYKEEKTMTNNNNITTRKNNNVKENKTMTDMIKTITLLSVISAMALSMTACRQTEASEDVVVHVPAVTTVSEETTEETTEETESLAYSSSTQYSREYNQEVEFRSYYSETGSVCVRDEYLTLDGELLEYTLYEYDDEENLKGEKRYSADDELLSYEEREDNAIGTKIYSYRADGSLEKTSQFDYTGRYHDDYHYNRFGDLVKFTSYSQEGSLIAQYSLDGKTITTKQYYGSLLIYEDEYAADDPQAFKFKPFLED